MGFAESGTAPQCHKGHLYSDVTICLCNAAQEDECSCVPKEQNWKRLENVHLQQKPKDLYLHSAQQTAWVLVAEIEEGNLTNDSFVVTDLAVGKHELDEHGSDALSEEERVSVSGDGWERRRGGMWVARSRYTGNCQASFVTGIDVLFGVDAVDPRPQWKLLDEPLQLPHNEPNVPILPDNMPARPVPRLTIRHSSRTTDAGELQPHTPPLLRAREDGTFRIVQISDTHMVTGVGVCTDALGADNESLPPRAADPLTVGFMGAVLDREKPDLVLLTGDQLHYSISDSQSALFKVVAPLVERGIPWALVFGNHDDEGEYALSREQQMALLQSLPFSLCRPGPEEVDGMGNYYLSILPHLDDESSHPEVPVATVFCIDTHGQVSSTVKHPDYEPIKQSQIDWFRRTSQSLRKVREVDTSTESKKTSHLSLAFLHIPFPEYADARLIITAGHRGEPTEGPSENSGFYAALVYEGVAAVGCGHDHVNDFCGLLPRDGKTGAGPLDPGGHRPAPETQLGPWLCYGGGGGFGGYGSYGNVRYHRRARVWELDTKKGDLRTWKRVEYSRERVDEVVLVEEGTVCASLAT